MRLGRLAAGPVLVSVLVSLLVAGLVLGPVLVHGGVVLRGDMVFVPRQPWKGAWLGLDGSVPRAVPMDALVSAATHVLPGGWVQKIVLAGSFLVAGTGISRLAGRIVGGSSWGSVAATTAFLWNPWVVERLSIGQWATVAGYALLPWVVLAAWRNREDPRQWPSTLLVLLLSGVCSPSSGLTAVVVAAAVLCLPPTLRRVATLVGCACVANAPWVVPALLMRGQVLGGASGFEAFHARGESSLGLLASAASLGGIWKSSVVPAERTSELVVVAALLFSLLALGGVLRRRELPLRSSLLAIAGVSLLACVVPAWAPGALAQVAGAIPGLSILRDSHRYLAPLSLPLAIGMAFVVTQLRLRARRPGGEGLLVAGATLVAAPLLLLPSAVWGISGDLDPVTFPREWRAVADQLDATPGDAIVLPWSGSYRRLGWNDDRAALDPAPRVLPGDVLIDDRLVLDDRTLPGEDVRAGRVTRALEEPDPVAALKDIGIRWVVVEKPLPVGHAPPDGELVHDGQWLSLVDLGAEGVRDPADAAPWRTGLIIATDCAVMGCALLAFALTRRRGSYAPARA